MSSPEAIGVVTLPGRIGQPIEHAPDQVDTWTRHHRGYWDRLQILARLTQEPGRSPGPFSKPKGGDPARPTLT